MKPVTIFYLLLIYIFLQFGWWSYLLFDLNKEVYEHKIENAQLKISDPLKAKEEEKNLMARLHHRWWMVGGEGIVFLVLLVIGTVQTQKAFNREMELARQQKNFLLSVTHEFKSPLASIKLYLQTLMKHDLEKEKQKTFLNSALQDTGRLNTLVENALLAAVIEGQPYKFSLEEKNISVFISDFLNTHAILLPKKIKMNSSIEKNIFMKMDGFTFSLLLNNLLDNAVKYSPEHSVIKVILKKSNEKIILQFVDEGIGVKDADRKKIFEKFYRAGNEETRSTKGTGLGLHITKFIAGQHGGKISVRDNTPKGSIFEVEFSSSR